MCALETSSGLQELQSFLKDAPDSLAVEMILPLIAPKLTQLTQVVTLVVS